MRWRHIPCKCSLSRIRRHTIEDPRQCAKVLERELMKYYSEIRADKHRCSPLRMACHQKPFWKRLPFISRPPWRALHATIGRVNSMSLNFIVDSHDRRHWTRSLHGYRDHDQPSNHSFWRSENTVAVLTDSNYLWHPPQKDPYSNSILQTFPRS